MSHATLMVHLEVGQSNAAVLETVGDLAWRMPAAVIGIAARQPVRIVNGEGYAFGELLAQDIQTTQLQIDQTEALFRTALQGRSDHLEWRRTLLFDSLSEYIARQSRSADLVITGSGSGAWFDPLLRVNMGDLVLGLGRPVLVVPANCAPMKLDLALVGWQDTREARRAVLDALPLLKLANQVVIAEIAAKADRLAAQVHLDDVVAWLQRHGVRAESMVSPLPDDGIERLHDVAQTLGADLIVAGAYGHNRLQE